VLDPVLAVSLDEHSIEGMGLHSIEGMGIHVQREDPANPDGRPLRFEI
jgi:hypothetical protein